MPISKELEKALLDHHITNGFGDRLFATAYSAFREAIKQTKLKMSTGQLTDILRHTYSSHFMMNGGEYYCFTKDTRPLQLNYDHEVCTSFPRASSRNITTQSISSIKSRLNFR